MVGWLLSVLLGAVGGLAGDVQLAGDSNVPLVCRDLGPGAGVSDADGRTSATLAMTMCAARKRIAALDHLKDSDVSRLGLELAAAPTLAILDEVDRTATPAWRLVAQQLRGDLYVAMAIRLRHAVVDADPRRPAPRVTKWLDRARRAYGRARTIAAEHPDALANSLARSALIASSPLTVSP